MHVSTNSAADSITEPILSGDERRLSENCVELELRIKNGEPARAEEYLARDAELDAEQALDLIYVEYAARRELGQAPPREEFYERFPQWHAQLLRQFQLDELLDELSPAEGEFSATVSGQFRVLCLLARGGIGQVMRAVDQELNREVAVKQLQPAYAEDDAARERFLREAEITGKLEHPGIVPVYGLGRDTEGRPFYAMRLVKGQSFQEAAEEFHQRASFSRPFTGVEFQKLLRRFLHVCETVAFAHSRGIVHRDLKPANVLLGPFGETLVVDWGLARATNSEGLVLASGDKLTASPTADALQNSVAHWSNELTQVNGELIGTPAYMSPEQAAGAARDVGPAADVYSLGATLYTLLTGRSPFIGSKLEATLRLVAAGTFSRPRDLNRTIPRALEAVCLKAMAHRPDDRYSSPRGLADDLEHWLADEPVTAAPEPLVSRLARWGRRHRTHVVAGSLALLVITVVSLAAAFRINNERLRADRERIEAHRQSARLAFDRAYSLTAEYEYGAALLWFAQALAHTPPDDAALRRVILTNMDGARHHLLRRLQTFSHLSPISSWAFSADGRHLFAAERSGTGFLWDVETGNLRERYALPSGRVVATAWAANGTPLAVTLQDDQLLVHRLNSDATETEDPPVVIPFSETLASAALHPRGHWLVAATQVSGSVKIRAWRTSDGMLQAAFDHPSRVNQFVFQPGTDAVATAALDGRVRLWHLVSKKLLREFVSASGRITRIAFTPDGKRLLAGDSGGSVSCWDATAGRRLFDVARHTGSVTTIVCATDDQTVAAGWDTGTIRTWNLDTRRPASELLHLDRYTANLKFRPQTRQLMVASQRTEFDLWELPGLNAQAVPLNQRQIESVAFSRDGEIAATGSASGTVRLRDGTTGRSFGKVMQHDAAVRSLAIRPDGAVIVTAGRDGTARLWKATTGEPHADPLDHQFGAGSTIMVETTAYSPDGSVIATGDNRGIVRLWNGDTGQLIRQFDKADGTIRSVCFSPRGDVLAAAFSAPDSCVRLWNVVSGELLWTGTHRETVRTIAFSPDGRRLISGSNDDTAQIRDSLSGQPIVPALVHRGEVFTVGFSPDGKLAVTGGYDATVRFWNVETGQPIGEPMRHEGIVVTAVFSADGKRLLTGSADHTARLWDVTSCLPLSSPLAHRDYVMAVGMNPSGDVAITGLRWTLPKPLADDLPLIEHWVQLATGRAFQADENIEWLDRATLDQLAHEFQAKTGRTWQQWAEETRLSSVRTAP